MILITILTIFRWAYKPTHITGGPHPVVIFCFKKKPPHMAGDDDRSNEADIEHPKSGPHME
jgi:hypothetical protein